MIYLDNAATSCPKPSSVASAITSALSRFGGVGRGVHSASIEAGIEVYKARVALSDLLGGPGAQRVSFALNATMALNIAIERLLPDGGVAVTTAASHNSVLRPLYKARDERACTIKVLPHSCEGDLDYCTFERYAEDADVVVLTHASNLTGDIYDVERVVRIAHKAGARVVLDAAQTAGAVPIDMTALGVDVLCFTGHKSLLGPQGTGGLIVAEGLDLPPLLEGGSGTHSFDERHPRFMPEALEAGTINAHGIAGLAAGVAYVQKCGITACARHEAALVERFVEGLSAIEGVRILGGSSKLGRCGIVAFNIGDVDSALVADQLAAKKDICVRPGAHCAPLMHRALGTEQQGAVRVSFGLFNTIDEIDITLSVIESIAHELKSAHT